MIGRPPDNEYAPFYSTYISQVDSVNPLAFLEDQLHEALQLCSTISSDKSMHRYAPEKWSIREVLSHVTDTERAFAFRVLWFGRGFGSPLPGYDQTISATGAKADDFSWESHIEDFRHVRRSTLSLLRKLPQEAWTRGGIASDNYVSVHALAYILGGHAAHHLNILRERYLS